MTTDALHEVFVKSIWIGSIWGILLFNLRNNEIDIDAVKNRKKMGRKAVSNLILSVGFLVISAEHVPMSART